MPNLNLEQQFDSFVAADLAPSYDILVRRVLVGMAGTLLWLFLGNLFLLIWGIGYVLGDMAYAQILNKPPGRVTANRLAAATACSVLVGCWVACMSVYLAWVDGGALYFLAACLVVGQALHCLTSHSSLRIAFFVDVSIVGLSTAGVTASMMYHTQSTHLAPAFAIGGITVFCYFVHSILKVVAERTAQIKRMESEAQDLKMTALGQFTSGVAHDFNNMLTVISGNIELARLETLPNNVPDLLNDAHSASSNAADLVRQLLAYSRKSTLKPESLDAETVLLQVGGLAKRLLPSTISFSTEVKAESVQLWADNAMLQTSLLNLIINARDALEGAPGSIQLEASQIGDKDLVEFAVVDSGPGMSDSVLVNATDPFFTTKSFGHGSGLGLSMVNGFAQQSGGHLQLRNLHPQGLRAAIQLPRQSKSAAA